MRRESAVALAAVDCLSAHSLGREAGQPPNRWRRGRLLRKGGGHEKRAWFGQDEKIERRLGTFRFPLTPLASRESKDFDRRKMGGAFRKSSQVKSALTSAGPDASALAGHRPPRGLFFLSFVNGERQVPFAVRMARGPIVWVLGRAPPKKKP